MADIEVRLQLPIDFRIVTVELDDTMTPDEVVNELIAANVIQPSESGYKLQVKGGPEINATTQLKDVELTAESTIMIIPATDAG